ncbi:MAG TPA: hypothetical protein VJ841_03870 [Candidatus Saccharimonadales bacterium]|nr:hypothetical protein [Candidatus Saccharimonadales bacterium]
MTHGSGDTGSVSGEEVQGAVRETSGLSFRDRVGAAAAGVRTRAEGSAALRDFRRRPKGERAGVLIVTSLLVIGAASSIKTGFKLVRGGARMANKVRRSK